MYLLQLYHNCIFYLVSFKLRIHIVLPALIGEICLHILLYHLFHSDTHHKDHLCKHQHQLHFYNHYHHNKLKYTEIFTKLKDIQILLLVRFQNRIKINKISEYITVLNDSNINFYFYVLLIK